MGYVAYLMVLVFALGNGITVYLFNRKRAKLDMTTEAGQKKDKTLRTLITFLVIETVLLSAVILIIVKPMLAPMND